MFDLNLKVMYKLVCEKCGKEFESKKKGARFCSKECYQEYCKETGCLKGKKRTEYVEVVCAECGKHEFVMPSRAKKYLCCSKECLGQYNSKKYNTQVELICPICGTKYHVKQSHADKSKTCGNKDCVSK